MSVINNSLLATPEGYQISRSVRLRSSASAYFSATLGSGNKRTFTYSLWVKRGTLGVAQTLLGTNSGTAALPRFYFTAADQLEWSSRDSSSVIQSQITTTAVYRDPSAWYHIVFAYDTTQAVAADRLSIYVNGALQAVTITTALALNEEPNSTFPYGDALIGIYRTTSFALPFNGYLTEVNFIDGQALTPSSFGETDAITGVWKPKKYTGTYGTNGFYLNFSDNSATTATTIGKDYSGNGNNWTPNNISVTAGATYDSMLDVPTLYADGGNGRGNYAVLNPLSTLYTVTAGNLDFTYTNSTSGVWYLKGTLAVSSDKYYWEVTPTNVGAGLNISIGIILSTNTQTNTNTINLVTDGYVYHSDGNKYSGAGGTTGVAYGATYTNNDVIGVALDLTAGTLVFYKNNVSQGTAFTGLTSSYMLLVCNHLGGTSRTVAGSVNAGQRPFAYTPPTGFKALNTQNLPAPTISNGAQYMAATTYTGNGATQSISNAVNGVSFQPDLVWAKRRNAAGSDHYLADSVRGATKQLVSNSTSAETTNNGVTSFDASGFSVGAIGDTNANTGTFVGWQWNAGGSTVTNTSGTISAQVRANATAGFSVVTYTGTGANATVGHGLGVAPKMIIAKSRGTAGTNWGVWHTSLTAYSYYLLLNSTAAQATTANSLQALPTSTLVSVGSSSIFNDASTMVMYCFAEVAGYSKFGKYTGNGSADGVFVYLGFRPKFIMIKGSSFVSNWFIQDGVRNGYNVNSGVALRPNLSNAEDGTNFYDIDILSNGFKLRTSTGDANSNGATFIFAAFAENPFKNSLAR